MQFHDELTADAAMQISDEWWLNPDAPQGRFLVLTGGYGTGKTTVARRLAGGRLPFCTFTRACEHHSTGHAIHIPAHTRTLVLDDVAPQKVSYGLPWEQVLWALIQQTDRGKKRLIITTNLDYAPGLQSELDAALDPRAASRLQTYSTVLRLSEPLRGTALDWRGRVPPSEPPAGFALGALVRSPDGWVRLITGMTFVPELATYRVDTAIHSYDDAIGFWSTLTSSHWLRDLESLNDSGTWIVGENQFRAMLPEQRDWVIDNLRRAVAQQGNGKYFDLAKRLEVLEGINEN